MIRTFFYACLLLLFASCNTSRNATQQNTGLSDPIAQKTKSMQFFDGYFPYWWDEQEGKIWLEITRLEEEFLYVNALSAGVGSNDLGLDRGQLGGERVVKFVRSGNKILLLQPNYKFRALSDNVDERQSVAEAFAQSILWGFKIGAAHNDRFLVDLTGFLLRDAHKVIGRLDAADQGEYKVDNSRSAIFLSDCKNFPKNTELEALLTFTGKPEGGYVHQVVPSPEAITVRQHHSFVELPDADYEPRVLDPRCGYFGISYRDYASPIGEPLVKRFIQRHRLQKKDPSASMSEAVEPIVYYLDRGAPEPVRSALLDGARWWNQAFEAAGYRDAFRVELLPEGVHPLDIRYNVIQWVHRSTRGWSYGSTVADPRTGEILKGHVSLGSLRVRQDFLIAQGLIEAYEAGQDPRGEMLEMALARLRQLSAHEVGHTLGLVHNFAASVNGRASVMDYPHPYLTLKADGSLDFSKAYDDQIGAWDKRAILYGYQDFPEGADENKALRNILEETARQGLHFISDEDARPVGGAHPLAHLWDNGPDAVAELERILAVRAAGLQKFGLANIPENRPLADLEEVLVPLYLSHRYQVEAVVKLIGGVHYTYASRGGGSASLRAVAAQEQDRALEAFLQSLNPSVLAVPENILQLIPPKPTGRYRGRENFSSRTGPLLDPVSIAEGAAQHSLSLLLHPARANRLVEQKARDPKQAGLEKTLERVVDFCWKKQHLEAYPATIQRAVAQLMLNQLMELAVNRRASSEVRAICLYQIEQLASWLSRQSQESSGAWQAHYRYASDTIRRFLQNPKEWMPKPGSALPDGSPIGCGH